jgi:replicative superfamily II helicase/intein/homing endonuclease
MDVADVPEIPPWLTDHLRDGGIESLYPPQAESVEAGVTGGRSLVASIPTASGKTLIAQLAMLSAIERGGKALYIVPLRALASEKREEFSAFEKHGVSVGVSTGNYEDTGEWLADKDIIVATSEKVDSLVRNGAPWVDDLDCVVADEVHLVNDEHRGPTLEVTLAKLRRINPNLQVVALSATVGNAEEMAEWLDAELIDSEWRPIELKAGVQYGQALHFGDGTQRELRVKSNEKPTEGIVRDTLSEGGSTLVFVNSRRNAEGAAKRLAETTRDGIDPEERRQLAELAEEIRGVSDTDTSDDLADCVERGAAFHHAGLCVTGDTQIIRPDGTFNEIRDIIDQDTPGQCIGLTDYSLAPVDITDTFEMNRRPVLKLTTRTGDEIRLSETHPLPVLSETGIEWVPAGDIHPDQYIARPRRLEVDVEPPDLRSLIPDEFHVYRRYVLVKELSDRVQTDDLNVDSGRYKYDRNIPVDQFRELCRRAEIDPHRYMEKIICRGGQIPTTIPKYVDDDLAWFAGIVAGDGYITCQKVSITGTPEILSEFENIVAEKFQRNVSSRTSPAGTGSVTLNSRLVSDILSKNFGIPEGTKGEELQMPEIGLPKALLSEYLSGLFDADGSVSPRKNENGSPCVELYSISERLITQIKMALLRFGIIAYKDTKPQKGVVNHREEGDIRGKSDVYRLTIYDVDQLLTFEREIGFRHQKKSEKLSMAIDRNPEGGRNQQDVIPVGVGKYVRNARKKLGLNLSDLDPDVPKATLSRFENGRTPMRRSTFQKLSEYLDDPIIHGLAFSDIYWDPIEDITQQKPQPLYDISTTSSNFVANGIIAHNTSDHRSIVEDAFRDRLIKVIAATPTLAAGVNTPSRRVVVRDWRRYSGDVGGMKPLSVLEVHQMMGRAGRPGRDPYGEALLLANSHDELDELLDRYVWADPEPVESKLAREPSMRTHLLATIASGFADSRAALLEFLDRTLYATQYRHGADGNDNLERIVDSTLEYLDRNGFIEGEADIRATNLGHTVSRLYLDPMSAAEIIDGLEASADPTAMGLYHLVSRTPDMYELYLRSGDREEYTMVAYERESEFLGAMPSEFEDERFEEWLAALKTARMLEDWASELDESEIAERYGVGPGDIRGKVDTAEWLLGAAESLASELGLDSVGSIQRVRKRVQHGVGEELIDLAGVRGVGRKRARRLHNAGIETRAELREAEKSVVLGALRGREKTAENVLEAAGHRNPGMDDVSPDGSVTDAIEADREPKADGNGQSNLGDF